ncbi:MAG: hypothetical protein QOJ97_539 [Solirubrobacteraceae bacterium]|nr:hypothetical protein [Solirubrobacteraceae bacterium]
MPRGSSGNPKVAARPATRTSQCSASTKPPAIAGPFTAATAGLGNRATAPKAATLVSTSRCLCARSPPNCVTSIPAQNAVPAPVSTAHATPSSAARAPNASASSTRRSIESALRFSGRRSVTSATAASTSTVSRSPTGSLSESVPARP